MTTRKQAHSQRNSGNVAAAQRRSAEKRRCPECGRGGAVKFYSDEYGYGSYCRWDDCKYARITIRD
jgi:hypothetical protein